MAGHAFTTFRCECSGNCIAICPTEAISRSAAAERRSIVEVDHSRCIDCGGCVSACPIDGAIIALAALSAWSKTDTDEKTLDRQRRDAVMTMLYRQARHDLLVESRFRLWTADCVEDVLHLLEKTDPRREQVQGALHAAREHARALRHYALEVQSARIERRPTAPAAAACLALAREGTTAWKANMQNEAASTKCDIFKLIAQSADAACCGFPRAATSAAEAVCRSAAATDPELASVLRADMEQEQFTQLLKRIGPRDLGL